MILVACDPGFEGAFAFDDTKSGAFDVYDMPVLEKAISGRKRADGKKPTRKIINLAETVALLDTFKGLGATHLVIEDVNGRPGQSAPAAFNFGFGCGVVHGIAHSLGYAIERVAPTVWKAEMKCPSENSKVIRARASELLPHHAHLWPLQKHDGRAEAAMLALWGERKLRVTK